MRTITIQIMLLKPVKKLRTKRSLIAPLFSDRLSTPPFWIQGWRLQYVENNGLIAFWRLSEKEKKIPVRVGSKTFKFGDGVKLKSLKTVILPCVIAIMGIKIISDVVDADILLLFSKKAMKRAQTSLNFNDDTGEMFGKKLNCYVSRVLKFHYQGLSMPRIHFTIRIATTLTN